MRRFAGRRRRSGSSRSPRTRNWRRSRAPLGLFYGPGDNEIAHNLCTAVIDPRGKLARLEVGTQRNKWENADLLKTIYSLTPDRRESELGMTIIPIRRSLSCCCNAHLRTSLGMQRSTVIYTRHAGCGTGSLEQM